MGKGLALGLGTACVVAAVVLLLAGYNAASAILFVAGVVFDLLFVKALRDERKGIDDARLRSPPSPTRDPSRTGTSQGGLGP
jgi:hypothetical protein